MIELGVTSPPVQTYRRSGFQVALLMFASLGLYIFAWSYLIRRSVATLIEQPDQPVWKTIALVVPIFNFFLLFDLGKKIQGVQWRADPQRVNGLLPFISLAFLVLAIAGRLQWAGSSLGLLDFALIGLMHQDFSRAQIALVGESGTPTRLNGIEWTVVVIGFGFWLLVVYGALLSPRSALNPVERPWLIGCLLGAVLLLVVLFFSSRKAIADGLAAHASPSPDRVPAGAG